MAGFSRLASERLVSFGNVHANNSVAPGVDRIAVDCSPGDARKKQPEDHLMARMASNGAPV